MNHIEPIAVRLTRGSDLKQAIQHLVTTHHVQAGAVVSCVGSLSVLNMRLAGAQHSQIWHQAFEIVSLIGTLTPDHQHLHIAAAKQNGDVIGGHLLEGSIIDTTAELIINSYKNLNFSREFDVQTGYTELSVSNQ